jgi:hypothetical protein
MSDNPFERRHDERRSSLNFLDYEVISASGEVTGRGMARTLNVSEHGLRLETGQFFDAGQVLRVTLGLGNDLVQLDGKVVNSQPEDDELCSSGVLFLQLDAEDRRTYQRYFDALEQALGRK